MSEATKVRVDGYEVVVVGDFDSIAREIEDNTTGWVWLNEAITGRPVAIHTTFVTLIQEGWS